MTPISVLVADDHEVVRRGVQALLEAETELRVCGEAMTGPEAVGKTLALRPDVVVLDIGLPELNGFEATRRIREAAPETEVLILTMHDSEQAVRQAWDAGARGFVLKSDAGHQLVVGVRTLARHRPFLCRKLAHLLPDLPAPASSRRRAPAGPLTPRESEVLQLIVEGRSSRGIAAHLGIRLKTVQTHRTNLMRRLDVHSVSGLVRYAIRSGMVEP